MSESFADLFEEGLNTIEMAPGSIVTGTVVDIDDDWVVVHAGLKAEGVIPKNQFLNEEGVCTLNVGDQVKVAMEVVDDGFGETRLRPIGRFFFMRCKAIVSRFWNHS